MKLTLRRRIEWARDFLLAWKYKLGLGQDLFYVAVYPEKYDLRVFTWKDRPCELRAFIAAPGPRKHKLLLFPDNQKVYIRTTLMVDIPAIIHPYVFDMETWRAELPSSVSFIDAVRKRVENSGVFCAKPRWPAPTKVLWSGRDEAYVGWSAKNR